MSADQILQIKVVTTDSFHQVPRSEVKQEQGKQDVFIIPEVAIYLSPLGVLFSWVVFFIILRKIRTFIENKMVFTIKSSHKVPCKNCQYYANNHYLKCAVQPSMVLREEAQDCPEYSPKKSIFSPKNLFHK
ncbi:hypothetical protein [Calothrix sp. PCC 7507]|uniref:hypothetical protein n=1 Tax=Calothrix sp. PCC 7507 TaxID=99598 RepID=UPI00029F0F53|nr:hypothetical protein [Calothrix sp. PCC 7507]AFY35001.1 hypothetical protein Cal7507_4638 [Calothrix sp. PCC 7507]